MINDTDAWTVCRFLIPWVEYMFLEISKPLHFWLGTLLELFLDFWSFPVLFARFFKNGPEK